MHITQADGLGRVAAPASTQRRAGPAAKFGAGAAVSDFRWTSGDVGAAARGAAAESPFGPQWKPQILAPHKREIPAEMGGLGGHWFPLTGPSRQKQDSRFHAAEANLTSTCLSSESKWQVTFACITCAPRAATERASSAR